MDNSQQYRYVQITSVQEMPDGERLFFEADGLPIVLYALNGQFYATGDECSHDGGPIGDGEIEGNEIICPRHGARFDIRTGKVTHMPAVSDIPSYPVRVNDGRIEIGIPVSK
jgi:3-phenylpropionate/trans-cinnamate dioxygenase ferredoxin component